MAEHDPGGNLHGIDLRGRQFGKLFVVEPGPRRGKGRAVSWICRCDCGSQHVVTTGNLTGGSVKSCGCHKRAVTARRNLKHGAAPRQSRSAEYNSWAAMRQRCCNPNSTKYPLYGAKGISVCDRWSDFAAFLADMGPKPAPDFTLERKDRSGNYEPENVIWADRDTQANNRSNNRIIEYGGHRGTLAQWARLLGLSYSALQTRLDRGWSLESALRGPNAVPADTPLERFR